ncbi:hypothetical protein GALL_291630 [mine drainage metagenome]|uniref:Uncharacterized protein n=1 Tax=mine drainage metagenome TaxID=410659 RepID=A0A1J5R9Y8_9ZZZZ
MQHLEVRGEELTVGHVERDRLTRRGVPPERRRHGRVGVLVGPHAVGRVHVERHPEAVLVQPREQRLGLGEELPVPRVAGPAAAVGGVDVDDVPVHVDDAHRERDAPLPEPRHEPDVLVGRVRVVAAPPVAEGPPRQHGRPSGDGVERLQRRGVVVPVREDVEVLTVARARCDPAVGVEEERSRVVDDGVPVA